MKRFFKSSVLAVVLMAAILPASFGQSYMRYKMKDGSFNGFYTSLIDSISHTTLNGEAVTNVHYGATVKSIPVKDIEEIYFEAASPEYEGDLGEYRVYEFDNTGEGFKKVYMDNRAFCIASKNGDFGANDTIFMVSKYYDDRFIFFTDEQERVSRYFDGKNYFLLDYAPDGSVEVVDYSKEDSTVNIAGLPGTKAVGAITNFYKFNKFYRYKETVQEYAEAALDLKLEINWQKMLSLAELLAGAESNPEYHANRLIYNG